MKKFSLILLFAISSIAGFSQGCPEVPSAFFNPLGNGVYNLTINFSANGQKHINVFYYNGTTLIKDTCIPIHGTGTVSYNITSVIVITSVVLKPGTGNCNNGNGNSCSATITPPAGGPLPVLISSFYTRRNNNIVTLNWQTSTEINAKEFIIQRNSGMGFVDIKTIAASNRPNGDSYTITDNNVSKGTTLYRIKMVDFGGSFRNSDTRTVKGIATTADYTVFPNPSNGTGKISITDIGEATDVQFIDNTGRIVKTVTLNNSNSIEVNNLQNGIYQLRIHVKSQETVVTRKLTVVN